MRSAGVHDVELLVIGREAQAVGLVHLVDHHLHLAGLAIDAVQRLFQLHLRARAFVSGQDAIARVGEPDGAIRMHHDIVRRVERLAVPLIGQHRNRAVRLVAHHAPVQMLAGKLAPLVVERVAIAVGAGIAVGADVAVLFEPAHLRVVGDVAPHQIAASARPRRTLGPQHTGPQPADRRVVDFVFGEALVQRQDVRIGISHRLFAAPVALGAHRFWGKGGGRQGRRQEGSPIIHVGQYNVAHALLRAASPLLGTQALYHSGRCPKFSEPLS